MERSFMDANTLVEGVSVYGTVVTGADVNRPDGILVKDRIRPGDYPQLKRVLAVVSSDGGRLDHASEICRIMGVPVMQFPNAHSILRAGDRVTVVPAAKKIYSGRWCGFDGNAWSTERNPTSQLITAQAEDRLQVSVIGSSEIFRSNACAGSGPAPGRFFVREEFVWVSQGIMDPFEYVRRHGVARTKTLIGDALRLCFEQMGPHQILNFRSLDMRSDEYSSWKAACERNPDLGWHGIRRSLDQPDGFKAALLAAYELSQEFKGRLLFSLPFINEADELDRVLGIAEGLGVSGMRFAVFVETPAAVSETGYLLERGVSEVYIGTKDLSQTFMSADRSNASVAFLADPKRRPVMRAVESVVSACSAAGVKVYLFCSLADVPFFTNQFPQLTGLSICCSEYERLVHPLPRAA